MQIKTTTQSNGYIVKTGAPDWKKVNVREISKLLRSPGGPAFVVIAVTTTSWREYSLLGNGLKARFVYRAENLVRGSACAPGDMALVYDGRSKGQAEEESTPPAKTQSAIHIAVQGTTWAMTASGPKIETKTVSGKVDGRGREATLKSVRAALSTLKNTDGWNVRLQVKDSTAIKQIRGEANSKFVDVLDEVRGLVKKYNVELDD